MGRGRFELPTPALSEQCSNQLSYQPNKKKVGGEKKDVWKFGTVQPHLYGVCVANSQAKTPWRFGTFQSERR